MIEFRSRRIRPAAGLRVDSVETLPTDLGTTLVRVAGVWEGPPAGAMHAPVLILGGAQDEHRVESLPETSGAAARVAPEDRPFRAAFSVSDDLAALLRAPLELDLGGARVELPVPRPAAGEPREHVEGTVVDRAVLVERRARRAELAEAAAEQRAQDAERAVARMEMELAGLELRLGAASEERSGLEVELEQRERELLATRQHAHAEQRLREDAVVAAEDRVAQAEREAAELRRSLTRADRRRRGLGVELAAARREADEARHGTQTARARARRAEHAAKAHGLRGAQDASLLHRELTLASSRQRAVPKRPAGASAATESHAGLLEAERRAARLVGDPGSMARLRVRVDREARALTAAEGRADEAQAAAAGAQQCLARERHERARGEVELGERILTLSRDANSLRAQADALHRARDAAQAEIRVMARAHDELELRLATRIAAPAEHQQEVAPTATEAPEPVPGPERPWLAIGLDRLVAENATAAVRLALGLLPGQALAGEPVSYDLLVGTLGWYEVTLNRAGGRVAGRHRPRETGAGFRLEASPAALAALVAEGGSRRLRRHGARVSGTLRRSRALRSLAPVPLDTGALADAGIWIDPSLLHRALALSIEPDWTRGNDFCLEHTIEGRRGGGCFVSVSDGEPVRVRTRPPAGGATTTVRTSLSAFAYALGRGPGQRIAGEGDVASLALLVGWARHGARSADLDE
ncbi:MAG: hypothetical protein M3Z33_08295 [Actinomycetota bacterium]|nr:hypothetical protein [Actinomycetota bacterium]